MKNLSLNLEGIRRRTVLAASMLTAWPLVHAQTPASAPAAGGKPDAAQFFKPSQMTGAALSPDGKRLAMRVRGPQERALLVVVDLETLQQTIVYNSKNSDVNEFLWVNNNRLALTLADWETPVGKRDAGPGLFAVNADGSDFKQLADRQEAFAKNPVSGRELAPSNTYLFSGTQAGEGNDVLIVRPEQYSEHDNEADYLKLMTLNTVNGRFRDLEGPLHALHWWTDHQGQLRAAYVREGKTKTALLWKDPKTNEWRKLSEFELFSGNDDVSINHIASDGTLYVTARRGRDLDALWTLDPVTGKWSDAPLIASPQYDIDATVVSRKGKVLGFRYTIDARVTQWLDPDLKAVQAHVDKVLPSTTNIIRVPESADSPWVMVEAYSDVQPRQYLIFNTKLKKFTRLGELRPDIKAKQMAPMDLVRIKARDGLEVPTWVTMPPGAKNGKNLPMVVLVHGGPFVSAQTWHFDTEAQFLAARGYVVIQPQFRGTEGYGRKYAAAGWRQWGKAMQDDVTDATRWAITQGIADPKRIAIAGASYGGYATLMGLVKEPGLYRCGISWVGVTDLDMLYSVKWSDASTTWKTYGMPKLVGDRVKDAEDLKANSPLTHAASIKHPLLLAYGSKDKRVPLVHGEKFKKAVQANNKQVEWVEYDDEGHGWNLPENTLDFWNRVARFLDKHTAS